MKLSEKYRPTSFTEIVGQDLLLRRLTCLAKTSGLKGEVLWLTGESGTGKTSVARVIAHSVSDDACIYEIDAQDVTMELLREWERKASVGSLFGSYTFIINESHGLSTKAVSRLQTVLEDPQVIANESTWIFTTTNKGNQMLLDSRFDSVPFLSRAHEFKLSFDKHTITSMAKRVMEIAQAEDVDGKPLPDYIELMIDCNGNMRKALNEVASGRMLV